MDQLSKNHTAVHEEFMSGNISISRSTQPFAQVWTDMALEQSINLDSKTTGGITGISQRPGAQACWFLMCHERAAITTAIPCCSLMCEINDIIMRDMFALQDSDRVGTPREAAPRRMLRDDDDVRKLLTVITSGLMTDPFSLNEILPLINIATSVRMPFALTECLISSAEIGTVQSDDKVCGTETDQQNKVLGFPPKRSIHLFQWSRRKQ